MAPSLLRLVVLALTAIALAGARVSAGQTTTRHDQPCPAGDRAFMASPDPRTRRRLVPEHPSGVLVCRYWGAADHAASGTLAGARYVLDGAKLDDLVAELDRLAPMPRAPAPSCPVFGGRSVLLLFRYDGATFDPVRITRAGCVWVSNGHLRRRNGASLRLGPHWPDEGIV